MSSDPGTCVFCGAGGGYLGEMGDEVSQQLSSVVKLDNGEYVRLSEDNNGRVTWCGECEEGLRHKFQRYDDVNLRAFEMAGRVRLELDGIRWSHWETDRKADEDGVSEASKLQKIHPADDPAIHMEKLRLERDINDAWKESVRRLQNREEKR